MIREGFVQDRLIFVCIRGSRIQVGPSALAVMRRYIQDMPEKFESGGVLLGRHILETDDIIIDDVTTPMPGDRSSRFQFFRASRRHQRAIDRAWRRSNGTCTYLGEWHTHPELYPTPSSVDRLQWQRKLHRDRLDESIFFVIIGISGVCVWEGHRDRYLAPLQLL